SPSATVVPMVTVPELLVALAVRVCVLIVTVWLAAPSHIEENVILPVASVGPLAVKSKPLMVTFSPLLTPPVLGSPPVFVETVPVALAATRAVAVSVIEFDPLVIVAVS